MTENKFAGFKLPAPLFEKNKDGGQGVGKSDLWKGRLKPNEFEQAAKAGLIQTTNAKEWQVHNRQQLKREEQQKKG
jgi:hypothetical protein